MISDEKIILELEQTNIFPVEIKEQFIKFFSKLNINQKELLQELLKLEKILLLHYLKTLRDKTIIQPHEIKYTFQNILKENIKVMELKEKLDIDLENMILQLETI